MRNNAMKMDRYIYCCKLVDDIYKCIQELKEVGYGHSKINEWFLQYCTGPINHLRGVFMDNLTPEAPADRAKHEYTRRP